MSSRPWRPLGGRIVTCVYPVSMWKSWPMCQDQWDPGAGEVLSVFMLGQRQYLLPLSCV